MRVFVHILHFETTETDVWGRERERRNTKWMLESLLFSLLTNARKSFKIHKVYYLVCFIAMNVIYFAWLEIKCFANSIARSGFRVRCLAFQRSLVRRVEFFKAHRLCLAPLCVFSFRSLKDELQFTIIAIYLRILNGVLVSKCST